MAKKCCICKNVLHRPFQLWNVFHWFRIKKYDQVCEICGKPICATCWETHKSKRITQYTVGIQNRAAFVCNRCYIATNRLYFITDFNVLESIFLRKTRRKKFRYGYLNNYKNKERTK